MKVVMAWAAQPGDAVLNVFSFEVAFVAFVGVTGPRDEMMPGKHRDVATTKFTEL